MDPKPNVGSFGSAIGGGGAIANALARRGLTGAGVTQQVSPAAPNFEPGTLPSMAGGGQHQPLGNTAGPQQEGLTSNPAGAPGSAPGSFESQIIIKALNDRLKTLSKIEESKAIPQGGF